MDLAASEALLEATERDATLDMVAAAPPEVAHALGLAGLRYAGGALVVAPGLRTPLFNRAFATTPLSAAQLAEIAARFHAARAASYHVQVAPRWLAEGAEALLAGAGLAPQGRWVKMVRGPEDRPAIGTDLRVSRVAADRAEELGAVANAAFGLPPATAPWLAALVGRPGWRLYAAHDGERMIASGALWLRGSTAWMGIGGTLPEHRGRGAQRTLMAVRIREAVEAGCTTVVTETGAPLPERPNPSYANMLRCGFRLAYERVNFAPATPAT